MVEFSVRYQGGLNCAATHGPSGAQLSTDAPADNMGRGESFSPTDLTCVSLATCMLTTMGIAIAKKSLSYSLDGASARVVKHMTAELPRKIAKIQVEFTLLAAAEGELREDLERIARNCPVSLSLHPDVVQDVHFQWPTA